MLGSRARANSLLNGFHFVTRASNNFMDVSCLECYLLFPEEHGTPVWDTEQKPIVLEGYLCNDCVARYIGDGPYEIPERERLN